MKFEWMGEQTGSLVLRLILCSITCEFFFCFLPRNFSKSQEMKCVMLVVTVVKGAGALLR